MTTLDDQLAAAVAAARAGQRDQARQLFQAVLRADPNNEMAWLWLSGLVDTPNQKRDCLQRVLAINPQSDPARRGMDQLAQSEAASFLAAFQPRTPPPAAPVFGEPLEAPEAEPITAPVPIGIDIAPAAADSAGESSPIQVGAAHMAPAGPIELPPPSKITDAPCVFCGAPTGPSGQCDACGIEQIFDCPDCSRLVDLREHTLCECGQSMQPFIVPGGIDREKLGDAYKSRDYPAAAVKQWKSALANSPRPAGLHRKIAKVYRDLGLLEQANQHDDLARQR